MKSKVDGSNSTQRNLALQILRDLVKDEFECAICLYTCTDTNINPQCGHRFCKVCIKKSLTSCKRECPICRTHIPTCRTLRQDAQFDRISSRVLETIAVLEANLDQDVSDTNQITENETSATNSSSNDSSDESQESCGKCVVSSNSHDMDSSMGGNKEAAGGGIVREENHRVETEESSATKMKPPLNHYDIIDITVEPEDADKIEMNSRVLVWWPYEKSYFSGTVDRIKVNSSDPHHILYDDGDKQWTNLCHCDFKRIDAAATSSGLNNSDASASESAASVLTRETPHKSKSKAKKRKVSEDSTLSKQKQISKCKRNKERCQGEDEMANKDTKQNGKKKRKEERTASYHHLVVPIGTDVINVNSNVNDNVNAHEDVVEEHTVAATELVEEGSITNKDGIVTSFAEMPALHSPPPVNSKRKHNQAYESFHEKWNRLFMELVEYKETNGHCNCPIKENGSLGTWIQTQRNLFKSKKLQADRHEKLVVIGFTFLLSDQQWQDMYQKLLEHKETNGHCFDLPQTLPLGKWLSQQRHFYRNGNLREDRAEKLLSVGFIDKNVLKKGGAVGVRDASSGQPPRKKRKVEDLDSNLAAITHDEGENGIDDINDNSNVNDNGNAHEDVVEEHTVAATELVEEGSITDKDENVTSLEGMPALHNSPPVNSKRKHNQAYESKLHEKWNTHFMELVEYKEKNGHCDITQRNGSLGRWISKQRELFRSKKLKKDRYEKLVGIGFPFDHESNIWNRHFVELVKYKETNGHCNIPTIKGSLWNWINTQRRLFTTKKLKADRYEKLVGIGFTFVYESNIWNIHFVELVKYRDKNGHCNIPTKNGSLGSWISNQRVLFRSKKLKAERYEKLVEIGFAFEDVTALEFKGKLDQKWQGMYQKLLEHKETNGHCFDVPHTLPLGRWLSQQRHFYRNGKLRDDRTDKLLSIGFDDKHTLKKGGAIGVRDATSGQPPRKRRKVEDLDSNLADITHDEGEGEEGINKINDNGDVNDDGNAHEEIVEKHTVAATELVEVGIKEGQKENEVAPPLEENNEVHEDGPAVSV